MDHNSLYYIATIHLWEALLGGPMKPWVGLESRHTEKKDTVEV